jgi:hypothetical protein
MLLAIGCLLLDVRYWLIAPGSLHGTVCRSALVYCDSLQVIQI